MATLKCKTIGNRSPQGMPRVYFCCHPDDFEKYFHTISEEILQTHPCAVWYADGPAVHDEEFLADLQQMQLFVMPVTTNLLCTENEALDKDFPFAVANHIPVLPLLQESGLETLFNKKCGDLHLLDAQSTDATAISYREKFQKYLNAVLIGDDLAEKIRAAFAAYIFLSYRKKDRKYAQALMRLIHKNAACRDIAIWYDEFLSPGENFNDSIKEALHKSALFVLAVTPNLVNETNYIMTTEYPMARLSGKPILPAELVPTDKGQLFEKYQGLPSPTDAYDEKALSELLTAAIAAIGLKESDGSAEHSFFMGLAYLSGVDVEVDHDKAIGLITSAAEADLPAAMEKLIDIYRTGIGVACDYAKVVFWQKKLYAQLKSSLAPETATEEAVHKCSEVVFSLWRNLKNMGFGEEAAAYKRDYYSFFEAYTLAHSKDEPMKLAELYKELSSFYRESACYEQATTYAEKAFALFKEQPWEYSKENVWLFTDIARTLLRLREGKDIDPILDATKEIVDAIALSLEAADSAELLSDLFITFADLLRSVKKSDPAEQYYQKAYWLLSRKLNSGEEAQARLWEILFSALYGLRSLKRAEENPEESAQYVGLTVDYLLRYIAALEHTEPDAVRRARAVSQQYSEIINLYRQAGNYPEALRYSRNSCAYMEKTAAQKPTAAIVQALVNAYFDCFAVYESMERMSSLALSEEEQRSRTALTEKLIRALSFLLAHYQESEPTLHTLNRAVSTLSDLITAHLRLGQTDSASLCGEERLRLSLDRYGKTRFLSDAYYAYYDASTLYKKLNQTDKELACFLRGLSYEEKELQGHTTRENQERLAYLYRKAATYFCAADAFDKGYAYFTKAIAISLAAHKAHNDLRSAQKLHLAMWDCVDHIGKTYPDSAKLLLTKMEALKKEWPTL